ncbi:methyltransferase domain-containing protein [uncultured Rhodoblastus sp.]|uniref:class I SAM-dependent methyltransferase n=1 Tax=uncultured Rhodoblastus sp. TaxID=543037 RepID=UPI0025EA6BE2|nr:methyltransferase domain-containing protein [uncultured Rhodoblastus sp.]
MNERTSKRLLNAGSGPAHFGRPPAAFATAEWTEVRLDLDPRAQPDIIGSFADMRGLVEDAQFDALYSSHAIEHLHAHEVIPALREFRRVLRPEGFALITCPDLAAIARQLLQAGAEEIAYQSPAGPIRPIDMIFGHSQSIADGQIHMAHHTGFTAPRLARVAFAAGFSEVRVMEGGSFDLWAALVGPQASLATIATMFEHSYLAGLFDDAAAQANSSSAPLAQI